MGSQPISAHSFESLDKLNLNDKQGFLLHVIKFPDIEQFYVDGIRPDEILIKLLLKSLNIYLRRDYQISSQLTIEGFIEYCIGYFANHKLIFVFDDTDEIYDEYATNLFAYDEVKKEYFEWCEKNQNFTLAPYVKQLIKFMRGFRGANIDFIVSLRPSSYKIATHTGHWGEQSF